MASSISTEGVRFRAASGCRYRAYRSIIAAAPPAVFLFTDGFDDWSEADFKAHIYNADYLALDPDYLEKRPRDNAGTVEQLFGTHKAELRVLDFGGGNDAMCSALRAAGFPIAETYDPFVADYARRPEERSISSLASKRSSTCQTRSPASPPCCQAWQNLGWFYSRRFCSRRTSISWV